MNVTWFYDLKHACHSKSSPTVTVGSQILKLSLASYTGDKLFSAAFASLAVDSS